MPGNLAQNERRSQPPQRRTIRAERGYATLPVQAIEALSEWTKTEIVVYAALVRRAHRTTWIFCAEQIARDVRRDPSNVRRALASLQRRDVIRRDADRSRHSPQGTGWSFAWLDYDPAEPVDVTDDAELLDDEPCSPAGAVSSPKAPPLARVHENATERDVVPREPRSMIAPRPIASTRAKPREVASVGEILGQPAPPVVSEPTQPVVAKSTQEVVAKSTQPSLPDLSPRSFSPDLLQNPPSLPSGWRRAPKPPSEGGRVVEKIRALWPACAGPVAREVWARLAELGMTEPEALKWVSTGYRTVEWRSRSPWFALADPEQCPNLRPWLASFRAEHAHRAIGEVRPATRDELERALDFATGDRAERIAVAIARLDQDPDKPSGAVVDGAGRIGFRRGLTG